MTLQTIGWMGPVPVDILVTNRTGSAVAVGDVEQLDRIRSDAASTTNSAGVTTAGVANIVVPIYDATTHPFTLACEIVGVCLQAVADDGPLIRFRLKGQCDEVAVTGTVVLLTSVGIVGDGTEAAVVADAQVTIDGNAQATLLPRKVVFLPTAARTGAGTTSGFFDGINGFGSILSTLDVT